MRVPSVQKGGRKKCQAFLIRSAKPVVINMKSLTGKRLATEKNPICPYPGALYPQRRIVHVFCCRWFAP